MTDQRAREALEAQGFRSPGPVLIEQVRNAIARNEEQTPAGIRTHQFDAAVLLADTPELLDRTEGPLHDPGAAVSRVLTDVVTKALHHEPDDDQDS